MVSILFAVQLGLRLLLADAKDVVIMHYSNSEILTDPAGCNVLRKAVTTAEEAI